MEIRFPHPEKKTSRMTSGSISLSFLLVVVTTFISFDGIAQTYTVIHSIGKIQDVATGKYLTKGMRIDQSSELKFVTPNARAAVLSSTKGRFIIQTETEKSLKGDLSYALSIVLQPARGRLSTRGVGITNSVNLIKHFEAGPIALFSDEYTIQVSDVVFPMNSNQFFYVRYTYREEEINKQLSFSDDTLILDLTEIYRIDDEAIDASETGPMSLFYYNSEVLESTELTRIQLHRVDDDALSAIASNYEDPLANESLKSITDWVNDLYGRCTQEQVMDALQNLR